MRRPTFVLACLGALAGCDAPGIELASDVSARTKSRTGNEYNPIKTEIRSFRAGPDGKQVEFGGAVCSGSNAHVSFSGLVTPGVVTLPTYLQADRFANRGQPPALTVTCRAEGKTVNVNLSASNGRSNQTTYSGGQYNAATGTYSNPQSTRLNSRLSSTLPWYYPGTRVEF